MNKLCFGSLFWLFITISAAGQVVTDVPPNERNTRFLDDSAVISMRPGLSIAGFSNNGENGLGLQQILNLTLESENSLVFETVSKILEKAKDPISLNPEISQIENTSNILQYLAFETLASLVLEQNGVSSQQSNSSFGLNIREHSSLIDQLTNILNSLTTNDKLVRKLPGEHPFDDYLNAIRSYNNMARALDLYLALENAYRHFGINESSLLTEQEKIDLMARFRADIDILFNDGVKRTRDLGGLISVTEDQLEAGNRPLKGYLSVSYSSLSAQSENQEELDLLNNYISMTRTRASESSDGQRDRYWMYQTANGSRFWAEGPFYLDFALKDAIIFWHAIRINEELERSFDPFFNDWFLNPVRWLADLSTPDGSLPPLDDSNKRPIESARFLRWNSQYGDEEIGRTFTTVFENMLEYQSEALREDQFYLVELSIPINEENETTIESLSNFEEQQMVIRHTDASNQKHYISFVGEKGESITSGEGHEQPDQLQLLYYLDEYSFLIDGGYDSGSPEQNSTWNGYVNTNTMQYNASDLQTTFDFVTFQNEGGLESPFASIAETRKVSIHDEAEISFENPAQNIDILSGQVDLNFPTPTESTSSYNRSVFIIKGENPYLIDINDITAQAGRDDFVMRYYGNSDQFGSENGWFFWDFSDQPFISSSHRLFLFTMPLVGNYIQQEETIQIQEVLNLSDNGEKQPYPVIRKSYVSTQESNRFTTASFLNIGQEIPSSEPQFTSNTDGLSYFTYAVNAETIDLFVFASDSSENKQTLNIESGSLEGLEFSLQGNKVTGFTRVRFNNGIWEQDSDFAVHLQSAEAPNPPQNLTVFIEEQSTGPAAILSWDEPEGDIIFYEIWKQLRNRTNMSEELARLLATTESNSYTDNSLTDLPPGQFEQRWFVKAVNSDSLTSAPSNTTEWIFINQTSTPDEFKLFKPFPNPMQNTGTVRYQLAEQSKVNLQLFDLLGREIISIVQQSQSAGAYTQEWNAEEFASGVYILRLTATPDMGDIFQESVMVSVIK